MSNQKIQQFNVIGISVRTTNENWQSGKDIPSLWNKFMAEGILEKIPNKIDDSIYCIYTEYEKDHTKPYTTILGCRVKHLDILPKGMIARTFKEGNYYKHIAKGSILQGLIFNEWIKIWSLHLQRTFAADFEVYGKKAQDPENAEVDIFISVK